jgi:guanylate kinase
MTDAPSAASGRIVIVSGPSGVGKSTITSRLISECPLPLVMSVSATTRAPRPGERDGVNYHFLTKDEFRRRREAGEFVECVEVFGRGDWYGTLRSEVASGLEAGKWVILEIDVDGANKALAQFQDAITIFIRAASWDVLEARLRGRGSESEEAIQRRLEVARRELSFADRYQVQVTNESVDEAVRQICEYLMS